MHLRTHVRAEHRGRYKHGDSEYIDGMIEHDDTVGTLLKALDDMGIANNTIVVYSSDNGPHMNTWPDGAMTWFRSEKNTNWEGAFRVPCLVRWPGVIKPGTVTNELMSHNDWIPTLCADRRRAGHRQQAQGRLHGQRHQLQGPPRRLRPVRVPAQRQRHRRQQQRHEERPRQVLLLRRRRPARGLAARATTSTSSPSSAWPGTMGVWAEPFTTLRLQKIFNLMQDPFERADITSNTFWDWQLNHVGQRLRRDGRRLPVRGDVQGIPAALVPAELQPGEHHGKHAWTAHQAEGGVHGKSLDLDRIRGGLNKMIERVACGTAARLRTGRRRWPAPACVLVCEGRVNV